MSASNPADTIKKLRKYAEAVEAGGLPPDVAVKVERMRQLMAVANVLDEAARLAAEIQRGSG